MAEQYNNKGHIHILEPILELVGLKTLDVLFIKKRNGDNRCDHRDIGKIK